MIKTFSFFTFFVAHSLLVTAFESGAPASTKQYIDSKLKEVEDRLSEIYSIYTGKSATGDGSNGYSGNWLKLWSEEAKATQPRALNVLDRMLLIDGKRVLSIALDPAATDNIRIVSELRLASPQDLVRFAKSFSWKKTLFLLVCQIHTCTHFRGTDIANLRDWETIKHNDLLPVDACYFMRGDQLYLAISYNVEDDSIGSANPTKIYQWTGTHMNVIDEILTPPAQALATFPHEQSTILLIALENDDEVEQTISCFVYELKDNSNAETVTFLNNVGSITSMYPYNYNGEQFTFLIGDDFNGIYWWDGADLKKWTNISEVKPSSSVNIVHVNNETLLFVYDPNTLNIYRMKNHNYTMLSNLSLKSEQRIIEIAVCEIDQSIMLALIKLNHDGIYQIELWKLNLYQDQSPNENVNPDEVWNCFVELQNLLNSRMSIIESLRDNWSKLLPASNTSTANVLELPEVLIDEGNITFLELDNSEGIIPNPVDIQNELMVIEESINATLASAKNIVSGDKITYDLSNVLINEDVYFQELHIDSLKVEYLNNEKIDMEKFLVSEVDQNFSMPLQAKKILVYNLEISSLCGLNSDHWLRLNDTDRTRLTDIVANTSSIYNDTIFTENEIVLNKFNPKNINGINIRNFLDDIFVLGKTHVIRGNVTYQNLVQVMRIFATKVNNISSSALITKQTNQSLGNVFISKLKVVHLYVDKINGVPINEAARMSQENVIKGKVTITNFVITHELVVNENISLPFTHPWQIYDEILINGNVFLKHLEIVDDASLAIGNDVLSTVNLHNIVENSWSKSRHQIVKNPVVFEKGISIDELSCQYLNSVSKHDFLYVNVDELDNLENVTFANFHFNNVIEASSGIEKSFLEESSNLVTFQDAVRISHLSVDNIFMDSYNGIPIDFIMQSDEPFVFRGVSEFEAIRVDDRMIVDDLLMSHLNIRNASVLEKALRSSQNLEIDVLKVNNINIRNLQVKRLREEDLEEALRIQEDLSEGLTNVSLTIEGKLEIEGSLQVDKINQEAVNDYIDVFKNTNLIDLIDLNDIKNLRMTKNLIVNSLNGHNVSNIFATALSKTNKQILSGEFTFTNVNISYLTTNVINNSNISSLMYINEPCEFYGNTSFLELFVQGNVVTKTLNNEAVRETEREPEIISMKNLKNLYVSGNLVWDKPSLNLYSVNHLLNTAITKHENQFINYSVTFEKPIIVDSLYIEESNSYIVQKVNEIISDAVIDDPDIHSVLIKGTKIFKQGLVANDLEVINNIDVKYINGLDIDQVASQIFRKYYNDTVLAQVTFQGEVEITNLIAHSKIHGIPLYELAVSDRTMPKYLHFEHLTVERNVSLYKLDGVELDKFKKNRVTVHEDHEIFVDVEFNSPVTVLQEIFVSSINGIKPTNLVVNNEARIPKVISGKKMFTSNLTIDRDVETAMINNLNINDMFNKSLLNNENIEIFGNLIFEDDIEIADNANISGQVNDVDLEHVIEAQLFEEKLALDKLDKEEYSIVKSISNSINLSNAFVEHVLYLEEDGELNIHLPGVKSVRSGSAKSTTQLYIYAEEAATFCGLQDNCSCRRQYDVEILPSGDCSIYQKSDSNVTLYFYEPNGQFGLKVVSGAVSYSEDCSKKLTEPESTRVYWMRFDDRDESELQELAVEVDGFLADAQVFVVSDKLYLIMAMLYDKMVKSHALESSVYEFNLKSKEVNRVQAIPTDGAKAIHVFQITGVGVHALIGCVKGKAESLLLRFNPEIRQFHQVRTFATGGSKHVASVSGNNKSFVILNNPDIEALQIFAYDYFSDNFYDYQNLYFESRIISLNVFYAGEFGHSEAFVVTATKDGWFYIYEYMFVGKFQLKSSHWTEDIQVLSAFHHRNQNYLFAGLKLNSTIFKVIQ